MVYFIFFSINSLTYYALSTFQYFLAVLDRLADVFKMEEFQKKRHEIVRRDLARLILNDATFTWGYAVKKDQKKNSIKNIKYK